MISCVGCWDQKIYENIGFVLQIGFETSDSGKILMSFLTPVVDPTANESSELIYSNANLVREFREKARKTSDKLTEGGKVQQVVISESLAYKGINNLLEIIEREATDPPVAYVIIAEGSVVKMNEVAKKLTDKPSRPSFYIHRLIENNIQSSYIPETRVFKFSTEYFSPGIDPIVPIIKLQFDKGRGIEIAGTAIFAGDKMVGKINTEQTSLLLAMMGKMKKTVFVSKMIVGENSENEKSGCAFTLSKVNTKLSVNIIDNTPVVNISLNFIGSLGELEWNDRYDENTQNSIENIVEREIKEKCESILKYTQEVGSDPIGIGDIVRAKNNAYWENVKWESAYKDVIFNVKVKFKINNHGIIR